ncbi:hypothetical protein [Embleya sp. MST-111070]|uniref:hypothetical protein n=1 Tax=Embleya sp. MST-111070 TaxID=3398231 RepID=UPI003F73FDFF
MDTEPRNRGGGISNRKTLVRERLGLVVRSGARGLLWAVLMISLFGTAWTIPIPYPWRGLATIPCLIGASWAGFASLFRLFVAFAAAADAVRCALRPGTSLSGACPGVGGHPEEHA